MRKVTKILGKIIASIILIVIIVPLTCSLLLTLEPVQSFVVRRAADVASMYLGTRVEVESAKFNFFTTFEVGGVRVDDFQEKEMIGIKSLKLDISALSILAGKISLDGIEASGINLNIREVEPNVLNISQVIEPLLKNDSETKTSVALEDIRLNSMNVSYQRLQKVEPEHGIDFGDIRLEGINAYIASLESADGVTSLNIPAMSGKEQSGLHITNFSSLMTIGAGSVEVRDFNFATPSTSLHMPLLSLSAESWEEFKDFENQVDLDIEIKSSTIAMQDVAYVAPALKDNELTIRNLSTKIEGKVNDVKAQIASLRFADNSSLRGSAKISGLPDIDKVKFAADLTSLKSSASDIEMITSSFDIAPLPANVQKIIRRAGAIEVSGTAYGTKESMTLDSNIESWRGAISYKGDLKIDNKKVGTKGVLDLKNLDLGALLARTDVGLVTLHTDINGTVDGQNIVADLLGRVDGAYYNSYNYSNIDFKGSYNNKVIEAAAVSHDKNIDFELFGSADLSCELPKYDASLRLAKANLTKLNINKKDSTANISGSMKLNLTGNDIENLSGSVILRNLNFQFNEEALYTPMVSIVGRNAPRNKNIELKSEFLDMSFSSKSTYDEILTYLKDGVHRYLPILYANDIKKAKAGETIDISNSYTTLKIKVKNFIPLSRTVLNGFNVADNTVFNALLNPYNDKFSMRLTSDYIEHKTLAATNLNINATNDRDSLSLYATAKNVYLGVMGFSSYSLMAGARNNHIELSTGFRDAENNTAATFGMHVMFDSLKTAHIQLLPSQFKYKDNNWFIHSNGIVASKEKVDIDNFTITNQDQRLAINGTLSKSEADTVTLKLKDYNIGLLTALVGHLGYNIDGVSNGYVTASSALHEPRLEANVDIDSASVNKYVGPPLKLHAAWISLQNMINVSLTNREKRDTIVNGYYAPKDKSYYAHLKIDSLEAGLIDPFLATTIVDTRGHAKADVELFGAGKRLNATGKVDLMDVSTKIIFTNVRYTAKSGHVDIKDNIVTCKNCQVFDKDDNSGFLTLNLDLDRLTNVKYNMRMTPENMLVLNTTLKDNELFYGTMYASGVATIKGDRRGVDMDLTGTSKGNSSFCMPLSWQSSVAKTDFITFAHREKQSNLSEQDKNYRRNLLNQRLKRANNTTSSSLNVNLALHATPNVDFSIVIDPVVGDIIRARGDGRFNMQIRPNENVFEMYGDYAISEGSYDFMLLNPIIKKFVVEPGTSSMQWSGDPINPTLNIDAIYKTKTSLEPLLSNTSANTNSSRSVPVDCIIHLRDRLMQPSVSFNIDVPTANLEQQAVIANTLVDQETISRQFFYLMFANSFIPVNSSISNEFSSTASVANGFDLLTNQLSNWLSSSNLNWVIRYRPESELTSDEIDLGFSRGLIDNRLLIEVEGNYLADNKTAVNQESASNFMGEAYITWLIDKAGTLKLKGFTQTIDSYDENQGMQETGVGIYYQESFDDWRDLPSQIRERFKRDKNKNVENNN